MKSYGDLLFVRHDRPTNNDPGAAPREPAIPVTRSSTKLHELLVTAWETCLKRKLANFTTILTPASFLPRK